MYLSNSIQNFIVFVAGACICSVLVFFMYSQILISQLTTHSQNIVTELDASATEAYRALKMLNDKEFTFCSGDNLLFMRKLQFESTNIKDIGFFDEDKIICTTGGGVLETPILEGTPDFELDGHKYWFNHTLKTFDNTVNGVVIKRDKYNVVLSFRSLLLEASQLSDYEIVAQLGSKTEHLIGNPHLFKREELENKLFIEVGLFNHRSEYCGKRNLICIAIQKQNFSEFETSLLIFSLFLILLLSGVSSVYIFRDIKRYLRSDIRRIRVGLADHKFTPYYQAIVDLNSGKTVGCEMLARFRDSQGEIYPNDFIPIVSATNQSWLFTEQLIKQTVKDFEDIGDSSNPFYVSINIFPKDINNQNVLNLIPLVKNSVSNTVFAIEITEHEELDFTTAKPVLDELKNAGIEVFIDDFGTGYSNFAQLRTFSISTLKIDKSFVDEVETGSIRSTLIPNIVSIANKLNTQIIAEGVENQLQVQALLKMDISLAQGWLFSKALPIKEFKRYLLKNNNLHG